LDSDVDEKMLYDTFSIYLLIFYKLGAFGVILSTKITRDPETGVSKNYGFVSFDSFESSDAAIQAMDNQYFCNRVIRVIYSYKKDSRNEKHGSTAERLLAANKPLNSLLNRHFMNNSPS
jgi:splicing factor 3B subunit 4